MLTEVGSPTEVARAYAGERILDEAIVTARIVPMVRALSRMARSTGTRLGGGVHLHGYFLAAALMIVAALKLVFPDNVGLWDGGLGFPSDLAMKMPVPTGEQPAGGDWIIPVLLFVGLSCGVVTHRGAGRFLEWCRRQRTEVFCGRW